jgi:GNAT superfamily N-acetyltransferase
MNILRDIGTEDREAVRAILREHWSSDQIVSRGKLYDASSLPGLIVQEKSEIKGLLTFNIAQFECEIISLNSLSQNQGVATLLIEGVLRKAEGSGCNRVWLVTTNDNLNALRFYQRRGFHLVSIHKNALNVSRILKPQIPLIGEHGIPLRDEIELEYVFGEK